MCLSPASKQKRQVLITDLIQALSKDYTVARYWSTLENIASFMHKVETYT